MKPNTITKTLTCSFSAIFLLSLCACQIKSLGVSQNQKAARLLMPRLMVTVPNITIATIPRVTYILTFQESATST